MQTLHIATFNIHKGVSSFNLRHVLEEQRDLLRELNAEILFLQEVRGLHLRHQHLTPAGQHMYLAEQHWPHVVYGKNATRRQGHHGNAVLSRHPIIHHDNINISASRLEERGLLHCEIAITGWPQPLHCICVHLGLFSRWRREQLALLNARIHDMVPRDAPLIIAGDFNDWSHKARDELMQQQHLHEVFEQSQGATARSFPAFFPMLHLDRIYIRGLTVQHSEIHSGMSFGNVSDHAALSAKLVLTP